MYHNAMRIFKLTISSIILALIILLGTFFIPSIAYAENDMAIDTFVTDQQLLDNEYAFKSNIKLTKGSSELDFYIPVSYSVFNPVQAIGTFYRVDYLGESYYIDSTSTPLETVSKENQSTFYPSVTLTIKNTSNIELEGTAIDNSFSITFFGFNEDSSKIFVKAVKDDIKKFGFINKDDLEPFNVPYQADTQARRDILIAQKNEQDAVDSGYFLSNTSYALRIIIIVAIAIPFVIFTLLIFKRNKNIKVQQELTPENKQEEIPQ